MKERREKRKNAQTRNNNKAIEVNSKEALKKGSWYALAEETDINSKNDIINNDNDDNNDNKDNNENKDNSDNNDNNNNKNNNNMIGKTQDDAVDGDGKSPANDNEDEDGGETEI